MTKVIQSKLNLESLSTTTLSLKINSNPMWYFLIKQGDLERTQYLNLQKQASLTEVERFNEPYESWYVFTVEKENYPVFMDGLDREGIAYELLTDRPTRADMLESMK